MTPQRWYTEMIFRWLLYGFFIYTYALFDAYFIGGKTTKQSMPKCFRATSGCSWGWTNQREPMSAAWELAQAVPKYGMKTFEYTQIWRRTVKLCSRHAQHLPNRWQQRSFFYGGMSCKKCPQLGTPNRFRAVIWVLLRLDQPGKANAGYLLTCSCSTR